MAREIRHHCRASRFRLLRRDGSGARVNHGRVRVGGLGVEFHMDFTYEFFNKSEIDLLDYCSADSVGICDEDSCDLSDTFRR